MTQDVGQLTGEAVDLQSRLEFAEDVLRAIRANEIDALVIGYDGDEQVCTLRGADEAYRIFVEAMGQGAATVALDGTILYCNRQLARMLGRALEKTIGASIFDHVPSEREGEFRALLWEGMGGTTSRSDVALRSIDGTELSVLLTVTPFTHGSVNSVCILAADLSEHNARIAAEAASRAKDQFIARVSHELRTPLTPVLMLLGAMQHEAGLPAHVREDLEIMRQNLEMEVRLVDDLLDLSRALSGKLRLDLAPVEAHELLRQTIRIVESEIHQRRIQVTFQFDAECDLVLADRTRLHQVMWNLFRNAVKFNKPGGHIHIRTRNLEGKWIAEIEDSGIGIDPEILPRLFEPFEQGGPNITTQYGGMGLGLAISKAIVDRHGGALHARSEGPDRGAVFIVELQTTPA